MYCPKFFIPNTLGEQLIEAATYNNLAEISQLLEKTSVNINYQNRLGDTALITAAYYGYTDVVRTLLGNNANATIGDKDGNTALHWACYQNHPNIIKCLLEKDPNLENLKNSNKLTPAEYANLSPKNSLKLKNHVSNQSSNQTYAKLAMNSS